MSVVPGAKLGPYEVSGPLGSGGMGEVWRGRDPRLGREVALKVLPESVARDPGFLARFRAEAQAASALNHPNIVTIYDVGEEDGRPFICMELLEGESLRELLDGPPIPPRQALAIAAQIAAGLAGAHERGIVHRDLKPENVVVTREGVVKVLDFGLAKVTPLFASRGDDTAAIAPSTSPGTLLGTVGYMSPEQASASDVDFRSDQFSLGTILYELLTGRRAWQRATPAETLVAILREELPLSSLAGPVPPAAVRVVDRCLAKAPADRYGSTRDLARDLADAAGPLARSGDPSPARHAGGGRGLAAVAPPSIAVRLALVVAAVGAVSALLWVWTRPGRSAIESLAILPFENRSRETGTEYLSDGLTESLIDRLSRVSSLRVMARATVFRYRGTQDPLDVGRKLGVVAILTGSVARNGSRLSVAAELVDVQTGERLWGERYDRPFEDVVRIPDAIAADIAGGLRLKLSPEERSRFADSGTESPEAYELFLKARHRVEERTEEGYLEALRLFRKASDEDPKFARATLGVGDIYGVMATDGFLRPAEAWTLAEAFTRKALAADVRFEAARAHLAVIRFFSGREWAAVDEMRRVFARRTWPNDVDRYVVAQSLMLWVTGGLDEAIALLKRARERDPGNLSLTLRIADCAARAGRDDDALGFYREAIQSDPGDPRGPFGLSEVLGRRGDLAGARAALQTAYELSGEGVLARRLERVGTVDDLAEVRLAAARNELARLEALARERYVSPLDLARTRAILGERDDAFEALAAALEERSPGLVFLRVDDAWDRVRDDPRFAALVERLTLP